MSLILSRREWIKRMSLVGMSAAVAPVLPRPAAQSAGRSDYKTYFGDLHITTSSATRKGRSSGPLRSPANHLDFFAFTPHGYWHDIGSYENRIENRWINGFAVTRARLAGSAEAGPQLRRPGQVRSHGRLRMALHFARRPAHHLPGPRSRVHSVRRPEGVSAIRQEARLYSDSPPSGQPARPSGSEFFDARPPGRARAGNVLRVGATPSMTALPSLTFATATGAAGHKNTLQYLLAQGHRMGVIASTDDHLGYPGADREGLAAVNSDGPFVAGPLRCNPESADLRRHRGPHRIGF